MERESHTPSTPLPPGLVASESEDDLALSANMQLQQHCVLKDADLRDRDPVPLEDAESESPPQVFGSRPKAWTSPERDETVTSDSSTESNKGTYSRISDEFTQKGMTDKLSETTPIFTQCHAGVDVQRKFESSHHGSPSKRTLSPFRRTNKVAPSPVLSVTATPQGKQPTDDSNGLGKQQGSLLPKRNTTKAGAAVEPVYSTVMKVKPRKGKDATSILTSHANPHAQESFAKEPEIVKVVPNPECYEPDRLDTSLVIANGSTFESSKDSTTAPESPPPVPPYLPQGDDEEDAAIYEEVNRPGVNSAVYKDLKKREDVSNVHLMSIRGIYDHPESQSMNFPNGSSADMQSIHYAAATGNKKALGEILSRLPVKQDTVERVLGSDRMCVRQGMDERDGEGRTALMHAVHNNHTQCVKLLTEHGATVNATADDGSSAVHQTAYSGEVEMLALLLSLGGNGMLKDKDGRLPLLWCTNNSDPECIKTLLDKVPGLDVNVRDASLMTPLMWAAFHSKPDNIRLLKEHGADQSLHDVDGMTALHWSVQRHDTRALQALINLESSGYADHKGKTVMHQAAEQGCAKAVGLIQAVRPTSVNDIDNDGRTPLHWATVCENSEVIRALLAYGADPAVKDSSDYTPLDYATENGLHYCGLLLSKPQQSMESDQDNRSYRSFMTYGTSSVTVGATASQQQEGQLQSFQDVAKSLTPEQLAQVRGVCAGAWIEKFTNSGKGPLHPRLFWVEPQNSTICWTKSSDKLSKETRREFLVGVRSSASPAVTGRRDFDPLQQHKYTFTIFTATRVLDVVAVSSEDYKIWLNGLQLVLDLGGANIKQLLG